MTPQALKAAEKQIHSLTKYEDFKKGFNKPLERIILYIDDLDRCPEERVVEVLEAVNLLMAFPLFVVVVGVDPRWVKNALIKKYQLQFTGHFRGKKQKVDNIGLEVINASDYLEKIFQVPFHLMSPSDESIQGMIEHLLKDSVAEDKEEQEPKLIEVQDFPAETMAEDESAAEPDEAESDEAEAMAEVESAEGPDEVANDESEDLDRGFELVDDDFVIHRSGDETKTAAIPDADNLPESTPEESAPAVVTASQAAEAPPPTMKRVTPESLKLHRAELEYMKDFAWLIGNTPRTVKRFVNMYRIIRAHEGLSYTNTEDKEDLMCILFLLALQTGPYRECDLKIKLLLDSSGLLELTFGEQLMHERDMLPEIANAQDKFPDQKHLDLLRKISFDQRFKLLREMSTNKMFKHSQFIERFRFGTEAITHYNDIYEEEFAEMEKREMNLDKESN